MSPLPARLPRSAGIKSCPHSAAPIATRTNASRPRQDRSRSLWRDPRDPRDPTLADAGPGVGAASERQVVVVSSYIRRRRSRGAQRDRGTRAGGGGPHHADGSSIKGGHIVDAATLEAPCPAGCAGVRRPDRGRLSPGRAGRCRVRAGDAVPEPLVRAERRFRGNIVLVAMRDIGAGEELTTDYALFDDYDGGCNATAARPAGAPSAAGTGSGPAAAQVRRFLLCLPAAQDGLPTQRRSNP